MKNYKIDPARAKELYTLAFGTKADKQRTVNNVRYVFTQYHQINTPFLAFKFVLEPITALMQPAPSNTEKNLLINHLWLMLGNDIEKLLC